MVKLRVAVLAFLVTFLLLGCGGKAGPAIRRAAPVPPAASRPFSEPSPSLELVSSASVPSLTDDLDVASLSLAIERSLQYYSKFNDTEVYYLGQRRCTIGEMEETLRSFRAIVTAEESDQAKQKKIRETFDFFRSAGDDRKGRVIFTGYYEPLLNGSTEPTSKYRYPLYAVPPETVALNSGRQVGRRVQGKILPHYRRVEIDSYKSLAGRNLEIVWIEDLVDVFFLQIQGSGKVRLPDGQVIQIGYAQSNGYPYQSIANYMLEQGMLGKDEISQQSIKRYLREHPDEVERIFNYNDRYVFFRLLDKGPIGSLGVPVTADRTIAADPNAFPKGALALIKTQKPLLNKGEVVKWITFSRFVLNQDTGSAINGAGRIDIFCGSGDEAEAVAGRLKQSGELFFLLKKR